MNTVPQRVIDTRCAWAAGDAKRDAGLTEPEDVVKYRNIRFSEYGDCSENNADSVMGNPRTDGHNETVNAGSVSDIPGIAANYGLLDVYIPGNNYLHDDMNFPKDKQLLENECPSKNPDALLPVLINVHGGGYFYGDKELYRFYAMNMAQKGFAVINFNYRRSPEYRFPAALEDINSVMCWLAKHAEEYHMDLSRVFMMGDSAGAQLTSHYAAINSNPDFAALFDFPQHGIKLKGISLACGVYDIKKSLPSLRDKQMWKDYLGENYDANDPRLDVLGAVTGSYPPAYLFSCPNDFIFSECEPMAEFLRSRGVRTVSKIYGTAEMKEVGHVFHCNMKLAIGEEARRDQAEFLKGI